MSDVRVRYAPSPTGTPHIGNIRTALWDWLYARHTGGTFIFRIEDTDKKRQTPTGIQEQIDTLRWFGLDWDEGIDVGGPYGPYLQSERLDIYHSHIQQLIDTGWAYRAYDSAERLQSLREEQLKRGNITSYDRRHRFLTAEERAEYESTGEPWVVRFAVPLEGKTTFTDCVYGDVTFENKVLEDQIILKSDGFPTYHFAATVDDHLMRITHVLRGEDWMPSAPLHVLIYRAFGWDAPALVHLPNMLGVDRKKLGKRFGSTDALAYREQGYLQEAMFNFIALQGWSAKEDRDLYTREELVEKFDIGGILNRSPICDRDKLDWYNGQYIRALDPGELVRRVLPFLRTAGLVEEEPDEATLDYVGRVMGLEQDRIATLADAPALAEFFLLPDDAYPFDEKASAKWFCHPGVRNRLQAIRDGFADTAAWDHGSIEAVVRSTIAQFEVKGGEVIHPLRVAITGRTTGPGPFESIEVMGKDRVLRRLDRAIPMMTG